MTWAAPWALVGLLALPLLWWLHKRLRRPPRVDLPSLMFLLDEADATALPRGRRVDAELLLALVAAACLALGAAGPRLVHGSPSRVARVVVAGGAVAAVAGYAGRVDAAVASVEAACGPGDRVDVVWEPGRAVASGRPTTAALLGAARAGPASLRLVLADRAPDADPADVLWIAIGEPGVANQGLVAVHVEATDGGLAVFANLVNHAVAACPVEVEVRAVPDDGAPPLARARLVLAPGATRSTVLAVATRAPQLAVLLARPDGGAWADDLPLDDRVLLTREPLPVALDPGLPLELATRVRAALEASLGTPGVRWLAGRATSDAALAILPRGGPAPAPGSWILELETVPAGTPGVRAPAGADALGRDPLVADLSSAAVDWVYAPGAQRIGEGEEVLLARGGAPPWPIVLRRGARVRLGPDPLRGEPAPCATPFWPLLLDNLARAAGGRAVAGAGYRATGLLDADASRPGRARTGSFEAARLRAAAPVREAPARSLRTPLVLGALACLLLLWLAPLVGVLGRWRPGRGPFPGVEAAGSHGPGGNRFVAP